MPFEVSDDSLLKVAAAGTLAYGAHFLAAPKHAQDLYFTKGTPYNPASNRWFGFLLGAQGAQTLVALDGTKENKKALLKFLGGIWLASSALHLVHREEGTQKRDVGLWQAVAHGAFGALLLWRGYQNDKVATARV